MRPLVVAFVSSLVISGFLTPIVRAVARRAGMLAQPVADRWHVRPVALMGGVAIVAAFAAGTLAAGFPSGLMPLLVYPALMFLLGSVDDVWHLRPGTKLVGQMVIAAAFLAIAPRVEVFGIAPLDLLVTYVWLIGIPNAFNLLDNMDGLSAGVALIAAGFSLAVVLPAGGGALALALCAFAGAIAGFLIYNFQPASIFMGDGGSFFLGAFLAATGLVAAPVLQSPIVPVGLLPVLILFIPIFDTSFVTLTRQFAGRNPMQGGRDHTSHRLVALGISERRAVLSLYALAIAGGATALGLKHFGYTYGLFLVGLYVMTLASMGVLLSHVETARTSDDAQARAILLSDLTYRYRFYEVALDAALIVLAYYAAFSIRFRDEQFTQFLPYFLRTVPFAVVLQVGGLAISGKYRQIWRTFGASETLAIVRGVVIGVGATVVATVYAYRFEGLSRLVFAFDGTILIFLLVGSRVAIAQVDDYLMRQRTKGRRVLIYGAGRAGSLLIREVLQNAALELIPVGFIDDDPSKRRTRLEGVPVVGRFDDLPSLVGTYKPAEILISIQRLEPARLAAIEAACRTHGLTVRRMRLALDDLGPIRVARHAG